MLLNVRGPSGAGKSYIGWNLTRRYPNEMIYQDGWNKTRPMLVAHELPGGLVIMGNYDPAKETYSGGLEGRFRPFDKLCDLVIDFGKRYPYVMYESLMLSSTYGRVAQITEAIAPQEHITGILDTPLETCIGRIYDRNGGKQIKENVVAISHNRIIKLGRKLANEGERIEWIDHTRSVEVVEGLFRKAGWSPD